MLDNALVHQKDIIISLIDGQHFEQALFLLRFSKELWDEANYGYKHKELVARMEQQLKQIAGEATTHWKTKNKVADLMSQCRGLAAWQ